MNALLLIQIAACAFMTGLIWIVQVLLYPSFAEIDGPSFAAFHRRHLHRISFLVMPVMVIELVTGMLLIWPLAANFFLLNFLALVVIWACTFFLSVPRHNSLALGKNPADISQLISTNWPRTLLWSARLLALIFYSVQL